MSDTPPPLRLTAEQRLTWIAEQCEQWKRYRESPQVAAPGSILAVDDALFPDSPPSHLIAFGIAHAVEHLDYYMYPLVNGGAGYPTAPNTIARSSVVGSAHALWMLDHPYRVERQRRALRMAHYEAANERTAVYEVQHIAGPGDPAERQALWQSFVDRCNDIKAGAVAAGATIGMTAEEVAQRPNDTEIIDMVAKSYIEASPGNSDTLAVAYRLNWRMHSGNAHALRWPAIWHSKMHAPFARGGGAAMVTAGGAEGMSIVASSMALFIKRAIELFEHARQRPRDR